MINLINKIPWIENILWGMLIFGAILCVYGFILFCAGQGGRIDKRFSTGRRGNVLGDEGMQMKGCSISIAGILLWVLVFWLFKDAIDFDKVYGFIKRFTPAIFGGEGGRF